MSAPLAFRKDIQGIRGIAILLVVLFHAGVTRLAGGFVGVDVFFVLSGFFITASLNREFGETGSLDIGRFYARRTLRLLPLLAVVLLATVVIVMTLYAPIDRADIVKVVPSAAFSSANIAFAQQKTDYFSSDRNPLMHTWSLAVEQQFYLLWPLVILLVMMLAQRRTESDRRRFIMAALGIVGALSLAASLWLTRTSQPWAFFGLPSRIWEFALGGAISVYLSDEPSGARNSGTILQLLGLLAIAIAVLRYDSGTPYPGPAALLPAWGAAALLIGGQRSRANALSRTLSAWPLQWVGETSYAWYLWHWPLVGLGVVLMPGIGVAGKIVWSIVALGVAWLTMRLVERPARDGRLARMSQLEVALGSLAASAIIAGAGVLSLASATRAAGTPAQAALAAAREDHMSHDCWATTVDDPRGPCEFGDLHSSVTIALLGDSHAEHWLGALDRIGKERGWKIVAMVKGGCPVADMHEIRGVKRTTLYRECSRYREAMVQRIIGMHPNAVILSSWDHYIAATGRRTSWQVTPGMWRAGMHRTYSRISSAGIPLVAIKGTPRTWFDVPGCLSRREAQLPFATSCSYSRARSMSAPAIAAQVSAARGLHMKLVDMNDQICSTATCGVVRHGIVIFTDDNHLTASFSRSVAPVLGQRLAAAFDQLGARLP